MIQEIKQRIEQIKRGEVPQGYKSTKVGIVPSEWEVRSVESYLNRVSRPITKPTEKYWRLGLRSHAKGTFHELVEEPSKINMDELYVVNAGDFILNITFAWEHAIAVAIMKDQGMLVSHRFPTYEKTKMCNMEYWKYYTLRSYFKLQLDLISPGGAGRNRVMKQADFLTLPVCIPSLTQQQKIAEILTAQDKVIEIKQKLLAEKQKQKKWLMQNLLTGKKRLNGFSGKWGKVKLKSISKKIIDKNAKNKYKNVFTNSAQHGIIPQRDHFDKDIANIENINGYYIVKQNDFVYNPRISVTAPCGPINCNLTGLIGIMSPLYTVFRITVSDVNIDYLQNYFIFSEWYGYAKSVANYGARFDRMNISDNDFFAMPIKLPPFPEQTAIAEILSSADREIDLMKKDIADEKQKKKALMQLLLTGIVRVNV